VLTISFQRDLVESDKVWTLPFTFGKDVKSLGSSGLHL
jgi:hypothetical protein